MGAEVKEKLSLKLKLKAWWEGYDADAYAASQIDDTEDDGAEKQGAPAGAKATPPPEDESADEDLPFEPWDEKRIDIAQYVWGDGFCGPGGKDHVISMSKLLALSPEMSMAVLGAGLGGPARTLADTFGAWVTAFDANPVLVEAGNELSTRMGMAKKVNILEYDPENVEKFDRNFDRALAKECLFCVQAKQQLLTTTFEAIKPDGLMLITDYVLASETANMSDAYRDWKEAEHGNVYPVTEQDLRELLETAGFSVRVHEDITAQHISLITEAWSGAEEVVAKLVEQEDGMALVDTLLKEAEFWARRADLFENGTLKVWRSLGYKKDTGKSMMSDW